MESLTAYDLPVYRQKQRILDMLSASRVLVVESPTGSGKTTQLPVILHEAGFTKNGVIGVTQPRRIAAISVSGFIARQLGVEMPNLIGYKMRFEDKTSPETLIKIMTDGILLQEMKLDPWLSKYSLIIVDEAHERSLNIDFVLGLLKRVLHVRKDFRVIISSATINAGLFSIYFDDCPVVKIDTPVYPVTVIYDPPAIAHREPPQKGIPHEEDGERGGGARGNSSLEEEAILEKIISVTERALQDEGGGILAFLPGERAIKNCIEKLSSQSWRNKLHILPLYGRLGKEEQERIFEASPSGKRKMIVATNIAETSVTIDGVTCVIDCGKAKLNFYNPRTYTSSLMEVPVSKASCNQRRGRAGRTRPGVCYRLYTRKDFESRALYTTEEIYRTDLSEVVLRMAELGIYDFEGFDFLSPPSREGIAAAVETLNLLGALEQNRSLSKTGVMMCRFPLLPRLSRMIVEAMMRYPSVIEEVIIASAFMSAQSPFLLPAGEELDARRAHLAFKDSGGDFASYLKIFRAFSQAKHKDRFCKKNFLDERVLLEIANIKAQIESIVSDAGAPISSGGPMREYLACIAAGMIQFVCVRDKKGFYRTLTADRIHIHPGSCLYRESPEYIVAGEIIKTSRVYAMTVSPVTPAILEAARPGLTALLGFAKKAQKKAATFELNEASTKKDAPSKKKEKGEKKKAAVPSPADSATESILIAGHRFRLEKIKGKNSVIFPLEKLEQLARQSDGARGIFPAGAKKLKGKVVTDTGVLLEGMKLDVIFKAAARFDLKPIATSSWSRKRNFSTEGNLSEFAAALPCIMRVTPSKEGGKQLGFITLYTDGAGAYWLKACRGIHTAINESLASLEAFIEETAEKELPNDFKEEMSLLYGKLASFFSEDFLE